MGPAEKLPSHSPSPSLPLPEGISAICCILEPVLWTRESTGLWCLWNHFEPCVALFLPTIPIYMLWHLSLPTLEAERWAIMNCICCSACAPLPRTEPWKRSSHRLCTCDQAVPFIELEDEAFWPICNDGCRTSAVAQGLIFKQSNWSSFYKAKKKKLLNREGLRCVSYPKILLGSLQTDLCRLPFFLNSSQWRVLYKH